MRFNVVPLDLAQRVEHAQRHQRIVLALMLDKDVNQKRSLVVGLQGVEQITMCLLKVGPNKRYLFANESRPIESFMHGLGKVSWN